MDDPGFFNAVFNLAALGCFHSFSDVGRYRAKLRVWHQAFGAEHLTKTTNKAHHVWRRDAAFKLNLAVLADFEQVFCANDISTRSKGFFSLCAACEHANANGFAGALGQRDNAAHHLIGMTRINAEVERHFDAFIKLRRCVGLNQRNRFVNAVELFTINR